MAKAIPLRRNIIFNAAGYAVSVLAAFLIAPITLHTLGDTRYGAWSLVSELIGYYGLLDLGIRGAVTYYVARHSAQDQDWKIRETVSSAFWLLAASGIVAFLIGGGLTMAFPYLFRTDGLNLVEVRQALLIMSGLIGLSLPMNAFSGSLIGRQRFDIVTGTEVINRILTTTAIYYALRSGAGLVTLAVIQAVGSIMSWSLILTANKSVFGGAFARPAWVKKGRVLELIGYGFRNAVGQVALLVIYRLDLTILAMFSGMQRVTYYTIGSTLVSYASALCLTITQSFTPRFTHLETTSNNEELCELYLVGMRITGMLVTGLVAGILVFGGDFIRLWLGADYVNGPWTNRSDVIMTVLVLANLPRMLQSLSWQRLFAMARVRFLMWLNVFEAITNLILSVALVPRYGPMGVALGTLFPAVVSQGFIMPIYTSRAFKIPLLRILRRGLAVPLFTGALMGGIGVAFIRMAPPSSWKVFFFDALATCALGGFLCLAVGFSREERRHQLARLRRGIVKSFAWEW